jgi:hypothetical protein
MHNRGGLLALAAAAFVACGAAVADAQMPPERSWADPIVLGDDDVSEQDVTLGLLGQIVAIQRRSTTSPWRIAAVETDNRGDRDPRETQLHADGWRPIVATHGNGDALAAWQDTGHVYLAERRFGGAWSPSEGFPAGTGEYSDSSPRVAVNSRGDTVFAWTRGDAGGGRRIWIAERGFGDATWREPRPLRDAAPERETLLDEVALSLNGHLALAYRERPTRDSALRAFVSFGRLGGAFGAPDLLPGALSRYGTPRVALDALGGAAVTWQTPPAGFGDDTVLGDLHLALRTPTGVLGIPHDLGTMDLVGLDLEVSDPGEVLVAWSGGADLAEDGDSSWTFRLTGRHVVSASTVLGLVGEPETIASWRADTARLAMNARGDAVFAYSECCPAQILARRRPPGLPFGPVAVVAEGDLFTAYDSADRVGNGSVGDVALDPIGNAMVAFSVFGGAPQLRAAALDEPALTAPLEGAVVGSPLPTLLPPLTSLPDAPVISPPVTVATPSRAADPGLEMPARVVSLDLAARGRGARGVPRKLTLRVRCDRYCAARITGRIGRATLRPAFARLAGDRTRTLAVPLSRTVRAELRRLLRSRRSTTARLAVVAAGARGGQAVRKVRLRIRRR